MRQLQTYKAMPKQQSCEHAARFLPAFVQTLSAQKSLVKTLRYNPTISQFYGVDPLAEKYPAFNPYNYTLNNPVMLVDPTGMGPEDEWLLDVKTGKMEKVGNIGGDEVQVIYFTKDKKIVNAIFMDCKPSDLHVGPIAKNYDGEWYYGVSDKDVWKDIPKEYQGHYMAWDLMERYRAEHQNDKTKINNIRQQ